MPDKPTKKSLKRQLDINNALTSARIEGFTPSQELHKDLLDYVSGHKNIEQLIKAAKDRRKVKS